MAKRTAKAAERTATLRMRVAAALVVAFMFGLAQSGCAQPRDERPGYRLSGEVSPAHIKDWSFSNEIDEIFIQTTPWYGIPHSATIWCAEVDGQLYIGSYGPGGKKRWEHNVLRNPNAKLRLAGTLYEVTITPIADGGMGAALDAAYAKKYDMAEVFGEDIPEWWYYRVVQRD